MGELDRVMQHQGRKKIWLAEQLGLHASEITRLMSGERQWTDEQRATVALALGVPEDVLFEVGEVAA